jgi:O-antigen/teichoic acid export membrane protein
VLRESASRRHGRRADTQTAATDDGTVSNSPPHVPERATIAGTEDFQAASASRDRQSVPPDADDSLRARQEAGLAALLGIAAQVSLAMSEAATTIVPVVSPRLLEPAGESLRPSRGPDHPAGQLESGAAQGRIRLLLSGIQHDHLVRNSLYLMLSSGIQAGLGFTFWIVMARLFSTGDVGRASSLISATALIAYFALFGLNSTLVRFLPTSSNKAALITAALLLVAGTGTAIGLVYILLTPFIAPKLAFVAHRPTMVLGFVLLAMAASVNQLTDSIFIASRKAGFCALTDGVVGGLSKIIFGVALAGGGAYGLFCASAGGFVTAAIASVLLIITALHWRPSLNRPFRTLKPLLKFSGANYVSNAFNLLPSLVVPVIVLDRLGAEPAAYYFVAFQMAALLYAAVYAVESAFLAEGSQAQANWRAIRRRSRRLAIQLFVPGCLVLAVAARWVLLAFGPAYSQHGTTSLELLAVAVLPIAACNWSWTVLRITARLGLLVFSCGIYAVSICGLAWVLAAHGLTAMAVAWPAGATLGAIVATAAAATVSGKARARHRKTGPQAAATRPR